MLQNTSPSFKQLEEAFADQRKAEEKHRIEEEKRRERERMEEMKRQEQQRLLEVSKYFFLLVSGEIDFSFVVNF